MFTKLDAFIFPGALKYLYECIQYMDGRFSIGFFYRKDLIDLIIMQAIGVDSDEHICMTFSCLFCYLPYDSRQVIKRRV